ncbi:hypothetical protein [Winogradskyella sp.]|uniref:hypothetical protein n=1 Tax=Winogradskyella sp. TaxID=1883156 RepID=UPI003BAAE086
MKFTNDEFTEIAFIFEDYNGASHGDFEKRIVKESKLTKYSIEELKSDIIKGLNSNLYLEDSERVNAYWALSKLNDKALIPVLRKWLKNELKSSNYIPVFQILVALDKLEEPAFGQDRSSRYYDDMELNMRDAKNYLGYIK